MIFLRDFPEKKREEKGKRKREKEKKKEGKRGWNTINPKKFRLRRQGTLAGGQSTLGFRCRSTLIMKKKDDIKPDGSTGN